MSDMDSYEPTIRFSERARDYAAYRPSYPKALITDLDALAGPLASLAVADIGSGTGILTKLLLEADAWVSAVEPNAPMREEAERCGVDARNAVKENPDKYAELKQEPSGWCVVTQKGLWSRVYHNGYGAARLKEYIDRISSQIARLQSPMY